MRHLVFLLFFVSGLCGLCYEIVWVRLAMASFGAITPVVSVVISVFMGGLAVGAWAGGWWVGAISRRFRVSPLALYGLTEALIAPCAVAVPALFGVGESLLLGLGEANSATYLASSAAVISLAILPWAVLMGATFPLMMAYLDHRGGTVGGRSFSYLYLANICGAAVGSLLAAFVLIELTGFRGTALIAGGLNLSVAALALGVAGRSGFGSLADPEPTEPGRASDEGAVRRGHLVTLFAVGFLSMAVEVAWVRAFGGMLGSTVYGLALILAVYLAASAVGSAVYRSAAGKLPSTGILLLLAGAASLVPLWALEWRSGAEVWRLVAGIAPLCAILGAITPKLVDEYAGGDPQRAGRAYAVNVVGCVLGPLVSAYVLLAGLGERWTITLLSLGFTAAGPLLAARRLTWCWPAAAAAVAVIGWVVALGAEPFNEGPPEPDKVIRTDHTATVVSFRQGFERQLLVNGTGMTSLTPITQAMVHLPAAHHAGRPRSALIICFGMGTSFRSALSWGMQTTAVELTPSVLEAFPYYHEDADARVRDPNARLVVDDGRRFLKRTGDAFDVIVIDPPPPLTSAGSGMLYSVEFYREAARRLNPGGVLQQWIPASGGYLVNAFLRSIRAVFPHAKVLPGLEGGWGTHVLASMDPIPDLTPAELVAHMPPDAQADFRQWLEPQPDVLEKAARMMLGRAVPADRFLAGSDGPAVTDDRPLNEYYFLRHGMRLRKGSDPDTGLREADR